MKQEVVRNIFLCVTVFVQHFVIMYDYSIVASEERNQQQWGSSVSCVVLNFTHRFEFEGEIFRLQKEYNFFKNRHFNRSTCCWCTNGFK